MVSIREKIDAELKQARVNRDEPTRNVIGMLKNLVLMELKAGKGVEENDALWLKSIEGYAKQLRKSIAEFEKVGERGEEGMREATFELAFCEKFLPTRLDEQATFELVRKLATEQGITDPKQEGRLTGLVMKAHREQVDADRVRAAVKRVLTS